MGKWAAAASDAAKAYNSSAPYSVTEVSQPTFYNATNNAWIFGIVVTTEDYLVKIDIVNYCCPIEYILSPMVIEACVITTK